MSLGASSLLIVAGLFTSRAFVDPPPLEVAPPRNPLQLLAVIGNAASTAGWKVEVKDQDVLRATYVSGRHSAEVQLKVNADSVALAYVNSSNLDYSEDGGERE